MDTITRHIKPQYGAVLNFVFRRGQMETNIIDFLTFHATELWGDV